MGEEESMNASHDHQLCFASHQDEILSMQPIPQ
jgi:hypothetical protein